MKAIMRWGALAVAAVALTACAGTTQTQWQSYVAAIQTGVPLVEAALAAEGIGQTPAIVKAEGVLNAEIATLSTTSAPTNAAAILTDVQALVAALPPTALSPAHQAEVSALLAAAKFLAGYFSTQAPVAMLMQPHFAT
jgi:hypothetical protein